MSRHAAADDVRISRWNRARRPCDDRTLAGAFGAHTDVMYATVLGMIPDCDLSKVTSARNAAGTGARIALLDSGSGSIQYRTAMIATLALHSRQ